MCVFARHDVTRDPPFSRLDVISCRNLLIYLGPVLQKRVIPMFHYALNPEGWLLLGASESVGAFTDLFSLLDKKRKIFVKKSTPVTLPTAFAGHMQSPPASHLEPQPSGPAAEASGEFDVQKEADRLVLSRYASPGVIINDDMEIQQFRGQTGPYLEAAPGKASLNLLKMARVGLPLELRTAIALAKKTGESITKEAVRLTYDDRRREINIVVAPIKAPAGARYFLVLFKDVAGAPVGLEAGASAKTGTGRAKQTPDGRRLAQLEHELAASRDHLQTIIQERDANNEELRAANEEIQSSNEELQSINEELETSKEELQSTNEELTTVNDELQNRNFELGRLNDDLTNLSISVNIATIMVDRSLRVRRFTSMAEDALGLIAADIGRPLSDINLNVDVGVLARLVSNVVDNLAISELEMKDKSGRWFSMRVRPYKTADNKIEGAVITFVDIDPLKRNQQRIEEARDYAEAIVNTVREPLLILDAQLHVISANPAFYRTFKSSSGETENKLVYELGNGQWNMPELRTLLEEILPLKNDFADFEVVRDFPQIGRRTMVLSARRLVSQRESGRMILLAVDDITERRLAEEQYKRAVAGSLDGFWITDDQGRILEVNDAYSRVIGYSRDELLAMRVQDVEAVESTKETAGHIRHIKQAGADHFETRHRRKDGGLVDFEITVTYSEATNRFYAFIHDITERNRAKALSDALNEINIIMSSTLDFTSIMPTVMSKAVAAIGSEAGSAVLREDDDWFVQYVSGLPLKLVGTTFTDDQQRHFALVHRTKAPLVVDDAYNDERVDRSSMEAAGVRSFIIVPLITKEEVIGALAFHYRSAPVGFNPLQIDFVVKLAASVSLAIESMRLYNVEREARAFGESMSKISKHLASTVDFDKTMKQLAADGAKAISADQCRIFMLESGRWVLRFVSGLPASARGKTYDRLELPAANLAYEAGLPVAIDDTAADERVNPKVMHKYRVRSMLAAPLAIRDRQLGVIFFDYRKPRRFSVAHNDFAAKLGSAISLAMENVRLYHAEHEIAETLQEAMLTMPDSLPGVSFGHLYESATEATRVGGDFYDLFELEHGRIGIVIGDVAGKGLGAAALTGLVKSSIKAYAFEGMFPAGVMAKTNNVITRTTSGAVLVTALFAILDKAGGQLTYCCAGHLPAMVQKLDGTVIELEPGAPVIGVFVDAAFNDSSVILNPGERLILYTDGIIEARRQGKFFGEAGLMRSIKKHAKEPIEQLPPAIFKEVSKFTGGALADDVALLAVSLTHNLAAPIK